MELPGLKYEIPTLPPRPNPQMKHNIENVGTPERDAIYPPIIPMLQGYDMGPPMIPIVNPDIIREVMNRFFREAVNK